VSDLLRERLQAALSGSYRLDRELGGGAMSRVFVAHETALGRTVVVKVLPPELAGGLNTERFKREIQTAARLQHPHVVPVLTAGDVDGTPYYTMPFVEGESLRARLDREGALTIGDAVDILRDVARALQYAHEHGVVHRDIKPDNVLLAGASATVADFGIAKALSASRTEAHSTLTSAGTSIGTPAYIAPEQAAGDVNTDHRADLYAFGCMAYELLCGETPFHGLSPQKQFVAHMAEKPVPILERRTDLPPALASLIMRCLEKEAAHRPQSAAEILKDLESAVSSGGHDTRPVIAQATRRSLGRALALYAAAFVAVAIVSRAAIIVIGLPSWVFPGSLIVMALGLPVILFTSLVHHQSRIAQTLSSTTPGGSATVHGTVTRMAIRASPFVTWRRTAWGVGIALGGFTLLVGGWMVLRAAGIGPAGSLLASGKLKADEQILVADFAPPAKDSTLGGVVTDALRTDLGQSKNLKVVQVSRVRETLRRMEKPLNARVDFSLAREIATREGIKAIVDGEVLGAGGGYVLAARLISAQSGDVLASFRESASEEKELIPAIDKLSRALRERIGESLRDIQNAPPLEQVTTGSLAALRKYVQGVRSIDQLGEYTRGIAALEEAIAIDTGFAMAYRKLALSLVNRRGQLAKVQQYLQKAFDHRTRLSDFERYLTEGAYWSNGPKPDLQKAVAAYEALIEINPQHPTPFNRRFPRAQGGQFQLVTWAWASGNADSTRRMIDTAIRFVGNDAAGRGGAFLALASVELATGHLRTAATVRNQAMQEDQRLGLPAAQLTEGLDLAFTTAWFRNDRATAQRQLDAALRTAPLSSLPSADRPYINLARAQAIAGQVDQVRSTLADFDRTRRESAAMLDARNRAEIAGYVALAEKKYAAAAASFKEADKAGCANCVWPWIAYAFDAAGQSDSAIARYSRFIDSPVSVQLYDDAIWLAPSHKRLGELYEAKGDRANAAKHYRAFVDLWKTADPELQPSVTDVRARLAKLSDVEKRP
jgi:tRNA A-37 threonylcarbamoyl transferase component Bud32/tetratricopeptide (TPR) repeat protein